MLDVGLRNIRFRYDGGGFELAIDELLFPKSTHTAIAGVHPNGATTLLRIITGELKPRSGDVIIGSRVVTGLKPSRRPILAVTWQLDVPKWWSVRHALINAVRTRSLDRIDRQHEYNLAVENWSLSPDRRISTLSTSEQTNVLLARIELLKPAILVADGLLAFGPGHAGKFYRMLRVMGTTVISAPAATAELAFTDQVVALENGRILQSGTAAELYARPVNEVAAAATGRANVIPLTIRGRLVQSVIGAWELDEPPFQGDGIAICRPTDFEVAKRGEDSDFVFGIEEAGFSEGQWLAQGMLTGGVILQVALPSGANVHKGRLLALRYDPSRFTLIERSRAQLQPTVPTDVVPPLRETR